MSYRTWIEYGYGIKVDDIKVPKKEDIMKMLSLAPKTKQRLDDYFKALEKDESWVYPQDDDEFYDDICEYEGENCARGLGALIREVIEENTGIDFVVCDDYNGVWYLLYTPSYPWHLSEKERNFTRKDIENILRKYLDILTREEIDIDYLECENGG